MNGTEADIFDAAAGLSTQARPGPIRVFSRVPKSKSVCSLSMRTDRSSSSSAYHRHVVHCLCVEFGEAIIGQAPLRCTVFSPLDNQVAGDLLRTESEVSTTATLRSAKGSQN